MKNAILKKLFIIIIISTIVSCFVSYFICSKNLYNNNIQNMLYATRLIDYNIDYSKDLQSQLNIIKHINNTKNTNITIFDTKGTVLADTFTDSSSISDNNIETKEIDNTLKKGYTHNIKISKNVTGKMLYVLYMSDKSDNYIIRFSKDFNIIRNYLDIFTPTIFLSIIIALALLSILAYNFSKSITQPLYKLSNQINEIGENNNFKLNHYQYDELNQIVISTAKLSNKINKTMQKLKRERNKIDYILNNMIEGFLLLDNNKNVLSINHSAKNMLECNDIVLGENITKFTQKSKLLNAIDDAIKKQDRIVFDLHLNNDRICSIRITSVQKNIISSSYSGVVIIIVDVTNDRNNRQMRQEFFSNVSHELKTPITSIHGFAELLESGIITDKNTTKDFLSKIKKETQNMNSLINDILMISKLESKVNEVSFSNTKIKPIIQDILSTYSSIAQLRNIHINTYCENITIYANPQQIQQLFSNLIGNAIKYNIDNGKIFIGCYTDKNNIIFNIKDTGIGIPKNAQERIFERFYRVDKGRSRKMGGTGLGLSIVKHIIQFYNGQISIQSEVNKGTEITVTLPNNKSNT